MLLLFRIWWLKLRNLFLYSHNLVYYKPIRSRSQWPRGLRRRSTAARLLRSWVRIPLGAWMFVVNVVCCQVEVSATDWSLVQRSPTDCGASLCVIQKPRMRGGYSPARGLQNTNPQWVVAPVEKKKPIRIETLSIFEDNIKDSLHLTKFLNFSVYLVITRSKTIKDQLFIQY